MQLSFDPRMEDLFNQVFIQESISCESKEIPHINIDESKYKPSKVETSEFTDNE